MTKTIEQVADDCGLDEPATRLLKEIMATPDSDEDELARVGNIVGALYRRIENLQDQIAELESGYKAKP